jgi:aldehyde:ferredoxin oxidoreductase
MNDMAAVSYVHLTEGKITRRPPRRMSIRDYIGGRFWRILPVPRVPAHADPLGPENKLIIATGPLSGLMIPGAGKCDFTTKSPPTGGYAGSSLAACSRPK